MAAVPHLGSLRMAANRNPTVFSRLVFLAEQQHADKNGDHENRQHRSNPQRLFIAPDKLVESVNSRGRASAHRFIRKMVSDVHRETVGALITAGAIFFQT